MSRRVRGGLLAVAASAAGVGLAVIVGSAGADPRAGTTTTLGSTTGTPSQNICSAGVDCTYVPFSSAASPGLQVPFAGTVTSFAVNSGSATGTVQLRVLRPAGNGQFTGAGTSPAESLAGGPQTFTVSLPVNAGDVLALENSTSALVFDTSSAGPVFTAYYQPPPGLPDGTTGAPNNNRAGYRLLLSASVTSSGSTTTTTGTTTTGTSGTVTVTTTVTRTVTTTAPAPPVIGNLTQSRTAWRVGGKPASSSRAGRPPVGTTFAFGLSTTAQVTFAFRPRVGRSSLLTFAGHPGTDRLMFQGRLPGGKTLKKGRYTVTATAANRAGSSKPATLSFAITG